MRTHPILTTAGCLAASLLLAAPADAQQTDIPPRLEAITGPPADVREMQEARVPGDPVGRIDRAHVLEALEQIEPGSSRPEHARQRQEKPIPGERQAPQEVREMQRLHQQNIERGRQDRPRSKSDLLEAIRENPGGAEMLEQARRRGAALSSRPDASVDWLAVLNPFRVSEAYAQSAYSLTLTPTNRTSSSPYGWLQWRGSGCCREPLVQLAPYSYSQASTTSSVAGPYAAVLINVPTDGFYVINFRGNTSNSKSRLYHAATNRILGMWDNSRRNGWTDHPVLVELSKGYHYISFIVTDGVVDFSQVNVYSL